MISAQMAFGLIALGASILVLWFIYKLWWWWMMNQIPEPSPVIQATHSCINFLEESIGGRIPLSLRNAYLDGTITQIVLPRLFRWQGDEYSVNHFFKADAKANGQWGEISRNAFVFAQDDFGNLYFVKANDIAIYYWDHDLGDISIAFESAEEFWKALQEKT